MRSSPIEAQLVKSAAGPAINVRNAEWRTCFVPFSGEGLFAVRVVVGGKKGSFRGFGVGMCFVFAIW